MTYIWNDKDLLGFQYDIWLVIPAFVMFGGKKGIGNEEISYSV